MLLRSKLLAAVTAATLLGAASANAQTIVLDASNGAVYDAILDGFPMLATKDGTPDFAGNALGVATKAGVTEERAIAEFSLAPLAGLTAADIDSVTLTFNIDDVVGSFGPGASFDGTAFESLAIFSYSGNGAIDLTDFNNVAGAPAGVVSTTSFGTITDATLGVSGPLQFDVDVTTAVKALVTGAATNAGFVFATQDENTATSIDNLGNGGAGPAGVNGSVMPFITVVLVPQDPPTFTTAQRNCQTALALQGRKYAAYVHTQIQACMNRVLKDKAAGKDGTAATTFCAGALDLGASSKVDKVRAKALANIATKCPSPLTPADIGSPCDEAALSLAATASCVLDQHFDAVQTAIAAEYASSCQIATSVGRELEYPLLCVAP